MSTPATADASGKRGPLTIVDLMRGRFSGLFPAASWRAWICLAAGIFGLSYGLSADDQAILGRLLKRTVLPTAPASEFWAVVGRRGGKSRFAAWLAVFLAVFRDYSQILAPGERGIGMVICPDRRQARVILRYIRAIFDSDPMLHGMVESKTKEAIHLRNGISIEVHTASFRAVRGYTVIFCIVDEAAFLPTDESAEPDTELLAAVRPAMATVPGALLMVISSPYAQKGELWNAYKAHFGRDDDPILVVQADTLTMNCTVPQAVIDKAYQDDPASAAAEYGAQFRTDIASFVSRDVLDACVKDGRGDLPRLQGVTYHAFVDPSGGSSDSMCLAIAHRSGERVVIDVLREVKPRFVPDVVVADFAALLRAYGIHRVHGDRYGGDWPAERFRAHGIHYQAADKNKSELYGALLPLLMAATIELPDHPRLIGQLAALERRTARGGKDSIAEPRNSHDDLANVCAGVAALVAARPGASVARIDSGYGQEVPSDFVGQLRARKHAQMVAEIEAIREQQEDARRAREASGLSASARDWTAVRQALEGKKEQ